VVAALVLAAAVAAGVVVFLGMGPDAPGRLRAEAEADGVQLRWNAVDGAAEYEVLRDGEAVGRSDSTTFLDSEVGSGAVASYTVVALTSDSERSDPSDAVRVTAALRPVTDLAAAVDGAAVRLTWGPVDNAESYQVLRDDAVIRNDLQSPPFVEEGLGAGSYTYTVVAIDENGDAASSSATVSAEISPWLGAAPLAAVFEELVPAAPGGTGWDGGTCEIGELLERATASHAITCTYPNGIYAEFLLYADQAALDERLAFLDTLADPAGPRTYAGGAWYRQSPAGVTNPAWEAWGFTDEDKALMEIYIQWDGHTVADLDTAFFYRAPWD
jgi:hypothetical protein